MRKDFVAQMIVEMRRDPRIMFLTADLGFNALEPLRELFPSRFINVGIAEQHLVGMAAGLALEGKRPVAYSIVPFVTMRAYEQIRTDICYDNLDVKIVGTGGGYNYASHGVTHHSIEDYALMRVLPHMKVISPGYSWEAREATKAVMRNSGPMYLRLGKSPGVAYEKDFVFKIGRGYVIREGKEILLISTGNVLDVAVATAERLEKEGAGSVCVISMPSIKPLDTGLIESLAEAARGIFTIEEHSTVGGLGTAVAETLLGVQYAGAFKAFGLPAESFLTDVGERNYLLARAGLEQKKLAQAILHLV